MLETTGKNTDLIVNLLQQIEKQELYIIQSGLFNFIINHAAVDQSNEDAQQQRRIKNTRNRQNYQIISDKVKIKVITKSHRGSPSNLHQLGKTNVISEFFNQ